MEIIAKMKVGSSVSPCKMHWFFIKQQILDSSKL